MYAPVALFVYNRPVHTKATVEALLRNDLASHTDLHIFSDAPKKPAAEASVREVREFIRAVRGFKSITIVEREKNFGLANSIIDGVGNLCERHGRVIVIEDDLVTAPNFLPFMNDALEKYKDEPDVYSVTGYSFTNSISTIDSTYFLPMTSTWGWATWTSKWKHFERNREALARDLSDPEFKRAFDMGGNFSYAQMAQRAIDGVVDSWGIFWYYCVFKKQGVSLFPAKSLVQNVGYDGTGTHSRGENEAPLVPFEPVLAETVIVKPNIKGFIQEILLADKTANERPRRREVWARRLLSRDLGNKIVRKLVHRVSEKVDSVKLHLNKKRCVCGENAVLYPSCVIDNETPHSALIRIGSNSHVRGNLQVFAHGGAIEIGDYCYVGDHTRIWSMTSIRIGNRVLISHNVNIHDNIAHSLSASDRHQHFDQIIGTGHPKQLPRVPSQPVVIEDDAWIGFNATVLKGVTIGRGAVVGACAVVTKDVEPFTVVVGNPARVVGSSTE